MEIGKAITLTLFLLCYASQISAWGGDGHQLICGLAESRLTTKGKTLVDRIIRTSSDQAYKHFSQACLWPDKAKYSGYLGTYENHFINIPRNAQSFMLKRDCAALDCILVGIQRSMVYLAAPAQGKREKSRKLAALRFLGHFIGDLHQPLHVSYKEDRGGNSISVRWFGQDTNLHSVWDVNIFEKGGIKYPQSLSLLKGDNFSPSSLDVLSWLEDSHALAKKVAYRNNNDVLIKQNESLNEDYFKRGKKVVYQQLVKAGNRLALIINLIAEGETPIFVQLTED